MLTIVQTATFRAWLNGLRDRRAAGRIRARMRRMAGGNLGDVKPVGRGVFEARLFHRPGYRLYFIREGNAVIVLLCGGDKGNQDRDIERAIEMAKERE